MGWWLSLETQKAPPAAGSLRILVPRPQEAWRQHQRSDWTVQAVAKLQNGPIFAGVLDQFTSGYPSEASLVDGQLGALVSQGKGSALYARLQAETIIGGLQMVFKEKATRAGDFLMAQLPELAYFKEDNLLGQKVPQGLFGEPPFPTTLVDDDIFNAIAGVGMNVALSVISSVPIVGRFVSLFVNLGMAIAGLIGAQDIDEALPPLLVPWAKYTKDSDEELVGNYLVKLYGGTSDWSPIWMPALKGGEWRYERAAEDGVEKPGARVFAPINGKGEVQWSVEGDLGAIPNTMRQAAPVQTIEDTRLRDIAWGVQGDDLTAEQKADKQAYAESRRYALNASEVFVELERPPVIIDTGAFKPAFAAIAGQLWQQVSQRGNPDMFKVEALAVRDAWQEYWGAFFEGGFAALAKAQKASDRDAMWVWAALTPYICLVQANGAKVLLGMPGIDRPHGGVLITPKIFEPGHGPATIATRTGALYLEVERKGSRPQDQSSMAQLDVGPPWTRKVLHSAKPTNAKTVQGERIIAVAWPNGEELLSVYQRPDVAITTPACQALAKAQRYCLERTLVSAYVRPVASGGLPAYGAFNGPPGSPGAKLRADCLALREVLLTHPARFGVSLADTEAIDPAFADQLRKVGVKAAGNGNKGLAPNYPPLVDTAGEPPPVIDPAGGLPFDRPVRKGREPSGGGGAIWAWVGGTVLVVGGAAMAAQRLGNKPRSRRTYAR